MARKAVVDAVKDYLAANWSDAPVYGENEQSVTPTDGSAFLMLQFPYANSRQISIGAPGDNLWRDEGAFRIVIHVERNSGLDQGREWADELADLFRGKDLTVLQTRAPSAPFTDDSNDDGAYWRLSFAVPYIHDYRA